MKTIVVVLMVAGVFLTACGQGTPIPEPTSTVIPMPSPTPTPVPTPTPLSAYDDRFAHCYDSQVVPSLRRMQDDLGGIEYAWSEEPAELRDWLNRLQDDANAVSEELRKECPIPDNPEWR